MQSQLNQSLRSVVLLKAGKQTLEQDNQGRLVVTDGLLTDWIIFYTGTGTWAADGVLKINLPIRRKLNRLAQARQSAAKRWANS